MIFLVKSDRYPANQREEMKIKTFKTTKVCNFLPYTETTEMLRDDFFDNKTTGTKQTSVWKWKEKCLKQRKCFIFCPTQRVQKCGEVIHRYSCNILPIIKIRRLRRRIHALNKRTILHLLNVKQYSSPGAYAPAHSVRPAGLFIKWENTFSKRFSSLQNEKIRFWSTFHVKMKNRRF